MPPKTKITREMILGAAFEIARREGAEMVNARTVAQKLNCSTQPVLYHFKTMEELKKAVYAKADEFHSAYLAQPQGESPIKSIGLQYIRFGAQEKHLFRFLFQTNEFSGKSISDLTNAEEAAFIFEAIAKTSHISVEQARLLFKSLFLFAHGYASMFANNELAYDESVILSDLELVFTGMLSALKGGTEHDPSLPEK